MASDSAQSSPEMPADQGGAPAPAQPSPDDRGVVLRHSFLAMLIFSLLVCVGILLMLWQTARESLVPILLFGALPCVGLAFVSAALGSERSRVVVNAWGLRARVLWEVRVPWCAVTRAEVLLPPFLHVSAKGMPIWGWAGFYMPLKLLLKDRDRVVAELQALRDSRPLDEWSEPARTIFQYYCGPPAVAES